MTNKILARIEDVDQAIQKFGQDRLFLVVDPIAYEQSGARQRLATLLDQFQVECFSDFEPNPKIEHVRAGVKQLGESPAIVIAIGGGTAIDIAKLICCFAAQETQREDSQLVDFFSDTDNITSRRHLLIAVPTTAGTGSEATQFAVVYIDETKHSVSHPSLVPDAVILDSTLTHSLPPGITTATGLDALTQAVESMWSVRSTTESIEIAEQALRLGLANLENAVAAPTSESRAAMMQAAHLAGQAINVSRTTAPHALSYTMTIRHKVPHGMAVALSIGPFMRFNARVDPVSLADPRGMDHLYKIFMRIAESFQVDPQQEDAMDRVADRWEQLLARIGCGSRLSDWGITQSVDRALIAKSVNQQRLSNNPRLVTDQDLMKIVELIA